MKVAESSTLGVFVHRIYSEYLEMPGLRLTAAQAQRLWALDAATCQAALDDLLEKRFLRLTEDGVYVRLTEGPLEHVPRRMAKSDLHGQARRRNLAR